MKLRDAVNPPAPPTAGELNSTQRELQRRLAKVLREAIPSEIDLDKAQRRAQGCYRMVAEVLVDLRCQFRGPDGEEYDLRGRSAGYREAVREAYAQAGADTSGPISKRLTAGVSYWVRKILMERFDEKTLREYGVLRTTVEIDRRSDVEARAASNLPEDPAMKLSTVIGILNSLAVDQTLVPTEEHVRSAFRAAQLLKRKLYQNKRLLVPVGELRKSS